MKVSSPGEFHPQALSGRVEDWRGGSYRPCEAKPVLPFRASVPLKRVIYPVSNPRLVKRSVRISRTALSC